MQTLLGSFKLDVDVPALQGLQRAVCSFSFLGQRGCRDMKVMNDGDSEQQGHAVFQYVSLLNSGEYFVQPLLLGNSLGPTPLLIGLLLMYKEDYDYYATRLKTLRGCTKTEYFNGT